MTKEKSIFDQFTGKYQLSKTLRFELETDKLKDKDIKELLKTAVLVDKQIDKDYHQIMKPLFDELHRKFVDESLKDFWFSDSELKDFLNSYEQLKKKKKLNQYNIRTISEPLRKRLVEQFTKTAKEWGKFKGVDFTSNDWHRLTDKAILEVLKKEHPEKKEKIKKFDRFFTYLSRFNQTRENLYSAGGESTAIATRIIDDNLGFFADNVLQYRNIYKKIEEEIPELKSQSYLFDFPYFSKCLLQSGIKIYNSKLGEINKAIDLWRRKKSSGDKKFEKKDYKRFTTLYRQILAEYATEETEWDIREDSQVTERVWKLIDIAKTNTKRWDEFFKNFSSNFETGAWDIERIYIPKRALNTITGKWFESRSTIEGTIADICGTKKAKNSDDEEERYKLPNFISLDQIQQAIQSLEEGNAVIWKQKQTRVQEDHKKPSYAEVVGEKRGLRAFLEIFSEEFKNAKERLDKAQLEIESKLPEQTKYNKSNDKQKEAIVELMRAALSVYQLFKYFHPYKGKDEDDKGANNLDEEFYGEYNDIRVNSNFDSVVPRFNALRNHLARKDYLQRKPWSRRDVVFKWKLNFDKPNLLTGWTETGEDQKAQYRGYILRKNSEYYLAISTFDYYLSRAKFPDIEAGEGDDYYEKLEYKQLNWGKNIAGGKVYSSYTKQKLGRKLEYRDHKKEISEQEHAKFLLGLIREKYLKRFPELQVLFSGHQYNSPKELQNAFNKIKIGGITFVPIRASVIDAQKVEVGSGRKKKEQRLFLFKLSTNSLHSKKDSIHSAYWNALLDKKANIDKKTGKLLINLGANAEIFFRPATPNLKQEKIKTKSGKIIGENYSDKKKKYIQKERYTEDKFFFHCPITLNAQVPDAIPTRKGVRISFIKKFNEFARQQLHARSDDFTILGLDRGERQLLHYCLIKQDGTVIKHGNLNEIKHKDNKGNDKVVDYLAKLIVREAERDLARKDLRKIEGIKELKEGYLSHVVYKIVQLILKYNAIVVLEDLDKGFKRGRFKIERQTYQKFEKALIQKLNYLVADKNALNQKEGNIFNGYQLSAPFESFKILSSQKQSGIIFYTSASYTSKTDPVNGWRPHVYINWSDTNKKIKNAFEKFKKIGWNEEKQAWIFEYNSKDFDGIDRPWKLVANDSLIRLCRERNNLGKWESKEIKPKELFDWIFNEKQWGVKQEANIKGEILKLDEAGKLSKKLSFPNSNKKGNFWQWLAYAWKLLCQIRNEKAEYYKKDLTKPKNEKSEFVIPLIDNGKLVVNQKGEDYILSPVLMPDGQHFDSRRGFQNTSWDGDANGAYNIARKGVILLKRIKCDSNSDLYISADEWDKAVGSWSVFSKTNGTLHPNLKIK